ncbi:hypothetical protein CERSUDRAFT_37950, partial [Gelatoporia subvermispora B]
TWKSREQAEEAKYVTDKEKAQLAAIREQVKDEEAKKNIAREDRDYEAGFGGQEDLEDRYATTSGEH